MHKLTTNPQTFSCAAHTWDLSYQELTLPGYNSHPCSCAIHAWDLSYQELILPGYNSTPQCKLLTPFQDLLPFSPFCSAKGSRVIIANTCKLEWTSSWPAVDKPITNYSLYCTNCQELTRYTDPGLHPKDRKRIPFTALNRGPLRMLQPFLSF